ncbi:MAG TPA: hypothetical protein PKA41_14960, partial [Verrucomicrobiota bacterium]|nr:hypothetical protein [Verrucomicrobiota bacterium]
QAGVVEVAMLNADKDEIKLAKFDVSIRHSPEVGLLWSANEKSFADDDQEREKLPGNYFFGRLVITGEHFVVHLADEDEIEKLVERGVLKASYAKNDKGEDTGPPILEALGKEQFDAMSTNGVNPVLLFKPDPDFVFARLNAED